ncbi:unnamed protein product [Schistosoma mattheei]|uniref:Uncharacterized protein n=1 Tax=Schistosoma mattheei TaxID=31246 RepID=A0A183PNU6_9TREM|nr:unnamed protein product [Schistosoma mattheei]
MAIRQIKSGKATGSGNIPAESLKSDIEVTAGMLHVLFGKIWEEVQMPMDWNQGHLIKTLNKDPRKIRGITLLLVPEKVCDSVFEPDKNLVDAQLPDQKARFCKDRSCTDQVATLRIIVEQLVEWN